MPIKVHRPISNSNRKLITTDYGAVHSGKPHKSLVHGHSEKSGRNNQGKITVRHRGGGNKRKYRVIDFVQDKYDIEGRVERIEYDPFRSGFVALVVYKDGARRYIPAIEKMETGSKVTSSRQKIDLNLGNRMPLKHIPTGTVVSLVELHPGKGAAIVRGAGNQAIVATKEGQWVHLKLPSNEIRIFDKEATASIGQVSNIDHGNIRYGKAGRKRWLRIKPTVKGKNMNPVDHPHGGGEGHSPIGLKHPKTPWGKPALGKVTRRRKKRSNRFIVRTRKGRTLKSKS